MKERVRFRRREQGQRRITSDDIVELWIIDMERLLREGFMSYAGPEEFL